MNKETESFESRMDCPHCLDIKIFWKDANEEKIRLYCNGDCGFNVLTPKKDWDFEYRAYKATKSMDEDRKMMAREYVIKAHVPQKPTGECSEIGFYKWMEEGETIEDFINRMEKEYTCKAHKIKPRLIAQHPDYQEYL